MTALPTVPNDDAHLENKNNYFTLTQTDKS